ncbi:MAG: C40 family peptidase [Lachnospiraceae bacterium]|nr:C40 family peptidase [Lachnospiraceae bacterium]MCM1240496.1 C40 family peptidase [Lachnospiraceae bacterium]
MKAIAIKTIVSLREKPSEQVCLDDELLYGMTAEILEEVPDADGNAVRWVHIRTEYRYEAYCKKEDLLTEECRLARWEQGGLCVVMQPYADVLSQPKVQGVCLASIPRGSRLIRIGDVPERESWVEVELADGRRGYTKEKFLGTYYPRRFTEDEAKFRSRLVDLAKGYLGTQYRWGGKSPLGIDCSGLTSMCYMLCGVHIYRNARIMEGFPIKAIRAEDKKPGDLLFFPGHIAMYLGNDRYIHSTGKSGSDGVTINSLNPEDEDFRQDLWEKLECVGSMFVPQEAACLEV